MTPDFSSAFFDYPTVDLREHAHEVVFLDALSDDDLAKVLAHTETRRFSAGESIITAGETDRALYLVTAGSLGVRFSEDDARTFMAIDAPSVVGEIAFLDGGPRSTSLYAISDGELMRLSMENFEVLAAKDPALGRAVLLDLGRIVATRLRNANEHIAGGRG